MISKSTAKIMYDHYTRIIENLTVAKEELISGRVKQYTIDDRTVTRFDIDKLTEEIEEAVRKQAEFFAILNGRSPRKAVGIVPRDF